VLAGRLEELKSELATAYDRWAELEQRQEEAAASS
jgi:hypothetical protein